MLVLLTSGSLSNPVPIDTVVQHWLLATDRDRIAVDLSFESPSMHKTLSYTVNVLPRYAQKLKYTVLLSTFVKCSN